MKITGTIEGLETTFQVQSRNWQDEFIDLGLVKILQLGQVEGRTEIPETFDELDDSYCSLGQSIKY